MIATCTWMLRLPTDRSRRIGLVDAVVSALRHLAENRRRASAIVKSTAARTASAPLASMMSVSRATPSCTAPASAAQIADEPLEPVVPGAGQHHVAGILAAVEDLEERVAGALRPDVLGERVVAGHRAAGVAVEITDQHDEQQLAVGIEGRTNTLKSGR